MTPHGEVRWTTYSVFQGEERWKSEGIQVGGPGAARGVIGNWFEKDYDTHGPAGPTAFWKVSFGVDRESLSLFVGEVARKKEGEQGEMGCVIDDR